MLLFCLETNMVRNSISSALDENKPNILANNPDLWSIPAPDSDSNKYSRGHALIVGGMPMTGAARLAARAARRIGVGLVTITCPAEAFSVYSLDAAGVIVAPVNNLQDFKELLSDSRKNVVLLGPGNGVGEKTKEKVKAVLTTKRSCVLDADALTSFSDSPDELFSAVDSPCVMTPHEGEFSRLFTCTGSKLERALKAAEKSNSVIVLKGSNTVIASPDGRVVINNNAPPSLATAGTGDVLAGIITGLIAQGMEVFEAACAGVWLHGEAANAAGIGLIAEDLPDILPFILKKLE